MKDFNSESTTQAPRQGFKVIEGGKSETPGHTTTHPMNAAQGASQASQADPELPPGFKRADHAAMLPGGIPVTDENGNPGELMPVRASMLHGMPPELALMMLMAILSGKSN